MKNLLIKRAIKNNIFPIITFLNQLFVKNERKVLLYITDKRLMYSLGPFKKYLMDNGYDRKYKLICGTDLVDKYGNNTLIRIIATLKSIIDFLTSKYVFYTSGQLPIKPSKDQMVIHLQHAAAHFKPLGKLANINNGDEYYFTYMVATSELFVPISAQEYGCPENCIKVTGEPMTDALLNSPKGVYDFSTFSKLLVWTPTFRNSDMMGYKDSDMETLIPLFDEDDYPELNEILEKYNIKLIVKLHPIQTVPENAQCHFSHLSIYSHDEFVMSEYDMFTLIANSDGLIGDYSSVSFYYLLIDKPQAYVVPDILNYANNRGFVFDKPEDFMGGHIVKTKEEFLQFIKDFAEDSDIYCEKRHLLRDKIFKYKDADSCKRIVELSGMSL